MNSKWALEFLVSDRTTDMNWNPFGNWGSRRWSNFFVVVCSEAGRPPLMIACMHKEGKGCGREPAGCHADDGMIGGYTPGRSRRWAEAWIRRGSEGQCIGIWKWIQWELERGADGEYSSQKRWTCGKMVTSGASRRLMMASFWNHDAGLGFLLSSYDTSPQVTPE